MIYNLYKNRGETPLECIERFRAINPLLQDEKMTYLGRLDPMAEGVMLVATGTDVKDKEKYLGLDKEYDFVAILGFTTDTYDVLGKVIKKENVEEVNEFDLIRLSKIYKGEREQKYPPYSSKTFASLKSFPHETDIEPELQSQKIKISTLNFEGLDTLTKKEFFGRLFLDIGKVNGDFRQKEILELWKGELGNTEEKILLAKFSSHVSSGTYIRSIVNDLGASLGVGATVLSIKRTRVGEFVIENSIHF